MAASLPGIISSVERRGGRNYGGLSREQRVEVRRARLVDAALELYGTVGYAATSIERLCAVANVSTRSFYEDMGSREALLIALVDRTTAQAVAAALGALEAVREEALAVRVAAGFRAYLAVTCRDVRTARVHYVEVVGVSETVEKWRRQQRRRISALLIGEAERAVVRGETVARRFDLFAFAIIGAVNSLAQELGSATESDPPITLDEICDEIARFVTGGFAGPGVARGESAG